MIQAFDEAVQNPSLVILAHHHLRRLGLGGLLILAILGSGSSQAGSTVIVEGMEANCALRPGATSFIIRLPDPELPRSFTLVNENTPVEGRFSIAVANQPLPPESPRWNAVAGVVKFRHKRLFKLSLVGIEASYLKLTFQVESSRANTAPLPPKAIASQVNPVTPIL